MKTNLILQTVIFSTALLASGAAAQTVEATAPADAAPMVNPTPVPNQIIYLPQLPNPGELASAAAAQKISVEQINQTSTQITVVYKYANGQTNTICYQLLSAVGNAPGVAVPAGTAQVTTVVPATTTVVYARPGPGYYYYDPYYASPWPWFAPVSIGLGFDFGHGYYRGYGGFRDGGFRGGFHGRGGSFGHRR
jgi:hypothetical protein